MGRRYESLSSCGRDNGGGPMLWYIVLLSQNKVMPDGCEQVRHKENYWSRWLTAFSVDEIQSSEEEFVREEVV